MARSISEEVSVFSLILEVQKEVRGDIKELAGHVSSQGAYISNISTQMDRVLNTIDNHSRTLAEHSERFSSLEASQEAYYRYNKKSIAPTDKDSGTMKIPPFTPTKGFFSFPPQSTIEILKLVLFSLIGLGAIAGGILSQLNL